MKSSVFIHKTADISQKAKIGFNTKIWNFVQVRENAKIGKNCIISNGVYIDESVVIGDNVKIQNKVSVYKGVTIEDGVFVGPHVCFTNDKIPRAINENGGLLKTSEWELTPTLIKRGASLGAHSVIMCGITVGKFAMVGSGAVVTKDVPDHALAFGNPARIQGFVCICGRRLEKINEPKFNYICKKCNKKYKF